MSRCLDYFRALRPEDQVALIHHTDPDGVSSGVILWKLIEKLRGRPPDLRANQESGEVALIPETIQKCREKGITHIVSTDLVLDENTATIHAAANFAKLCIIDHHKLYSDVNSERIVMIKPQMVYEGVDPSQVCAAIFCYHIAKELVDVQDLDWIAAIGIIGDMGTPTWKEFLQKTAERHSIPLQGDIFKTPFGLAAASISSAEAQDIANVEKCFNILKNAKGVQDVLDSEIAELREAVEEEISYWVDNAEGKAEFFGPQRLIWYEVAPKYNIKSQIGSFLSLKYPDRAIVSVHIRDDKAYVSARCRDGRAMNDLLEKATQDIDGASGGGHVPAAGATVPAGKLEEFKKKVIEVLS